MISPRTGQTVSASSWFATNTLQEGRYNCRELSHRAILNFTQAIDVHNVSGVIEYEEIYTRANQVSAARSAFFNNDLRLISAGDSGTSRTCQAFNDPGNYTGACFDDAWRVRSFFGRANYTFDDRYSFQANVRYYGYSRFADVYRCGFFLSFSTCWWIS